MRRILLLIWFLALNPDCLRSEEYRIWTDSLGRELRAEFLYVNKGLVGLKLDGGREAVVGVDALSETDRDYITKELANSRPPTSAKMPDKAGLFADPLIVNGGPAIFETRWFQFENGEPTTNEFVNKAAQIFEATRRAVNSLPLHLETDPPQGQEKFKAKFVTRERFDAFINQTPDLNSRDKIAGVYDPKLRSIWVPYDQLGVQKVNGRITVNQVSDSSTLVHEITHQLMHDRLPLTPIWISEGLAEYMAAIPYRDGVFDFTKAEQGFLKRLKDRYSSLIVELPPVAELMRRRQNDWRGHNDDYVSSMVYVYFFMHLDQPDAPGSPLAAYLYLAGAAKNDTHTLIGDYNSEVRDYNSKVVDYNTALVKYKESVNDFKQEVRDYNATIDKFNQQVTQGISARHLIEVGPKPIPPQIPIEPEMSSLLKNKQFSSPIDLFRIAHEHAVPALMRGREHADVEESIIQEFEKIGVTVQFTERKLN